MPCPVCNFWAGDGVCPNCRRDGYIERWCGCIETPTGDRLACGEQHELCSVCRRNERQHTSDKCGDCISDEEMEQRHLDRLQWSA